ncbi:serine/threonine-protein phosphatase 4 regulatory subunit 1-like [Styela clava]
MTDLRIVLNLPNEDMEVDMDENFDDQEDDNNEGDQHGQMSFSTIGSGIMAFNDSSIPSPLDVTTPEELLTPLARLRCFAVSDNIFNRRMIAHDACNVFEAVQNDEKDFESAIQCYLKLSEDLEPSVRVELMEQLAEITEIFHTRLLDSAVVPILLRYLTDVNNQVRKTCHSVLVDITKAGYLKVGQFENEILPLLKDLTSRKQAPDEYRTEAIALVCQICESFGSEFAKEYFLPIFLDSCSDDTIFHVRKVCAANFSAFCDILDDALINKDLLPRFIGLCKDNVWGVRKSCAESFPDFAKHMSEEVRINTLSPLYSGLLSDQSRWVRVAAFESLGPFISTFADSKSASDNFNQAATGVPGYKITDDELKYDFDSFLYWRDPIPPVTFEEDFDDVTPMDQNKETDEIQSQVYVNSSNPTHQNEEDKPDEQLEQKETSKQLKVQTAVEQQDDDVYSPTKDDVLKSIEFSAEKENMPIHFDINLDKAENENAESAEIKDDKQEEEYDELNAVPSINLTTTNGNVEVFTDDSGLEKTTEEVIPNDDSDLAKGDSTESSITEETKEQTETVTEKTPSAAENGNQESSEDSDDEYYDENEPRNWQSPSLQEYPDLYETESSDNMEINYRMFSTLNDINYTRDFADRISGSDHYAHFDPISSVHSPTSKASSQQSVIPQQLLDNFLSMTDPSRKQTVDTEITMHCAYSLPGVAYTLGRNNWHCLKDVYQKLASDVQWKVRRTIASSIHELAKILGEELTATELVPVFNGFLKDLDDVRIGVLRHLAEFLKLLKPEVRGIYLYQLTDFLTIDNSRNWRFRYELARQLCSLTELYNCDDIVKYICPITMRLATDRVVAVQVEAGGLIGRLLNELHESGDERNFQIFTERVTSALAKSTRWKERALFCKICNLILRELLLPFNIFLKYFSTTLVEMARDGIVNVRIIAAQALSYAVQTFCDEGEGEEMCAMLKELQSDKDRDVKFFSAISC